MNLTAHQISVLSRYGDLRARFPQAGKDSPPELNAGYLQWWDGDFPTERLKRGTPDFQPGRCEMACCEALVAPPAPAPEPALATSPLVAPFVTRATPPTPPAVVYEGPLDQASGYGSAAWNNVLALLRAGVWVQPAGNCPEVPALDRQYLGPPGGWAKRHVLHSAPLDDTRADIRYTIQEIGNIPDEWVTRLNRDGQMWTASAYARRLFQEAGVITPIHVVPHCLDEREYRPALPRLALPSEGFTFLWLGHWMERKNPKGALAAFLRAFDGRKDVTLLVRANARPEGGDAYQGVSLDACRVATALGVRSPPRVVYLDRVDPRALPNLYASVDCLYHPVRAEGFGVPLLEAMASGVPIITTDYPAMNEVVDPTCARLVKCTPVAVPREAMAWARQSYSWDKPAVWAEPDGDDLQAALTEMADDPDRATSMGLRGRQRFMRLYTHRVVGQTMRRLLEASA